MVGVVGGDAVDVVVVGTSPSSSSGVCFWGESYVKFLLKISTPWKVFIFFLTGYEISQMEIVVTRMTSRIAATAIILFFCIFSPDFFTNNCVLASTKIPPLLAKSPLNNLRI